MSDAQVYVIDCTHAQGTITVPQMHARLSEMAKKYCFQLERGDSGYMHYQIRCSLFKKRRCQEVARIFNVDGWMFGGISPSSKASLEKEAFYVMKADTRVEGPWTDQDYKKPKELTRQMAEFSAYEPYPWQKDVLRMATEWDKRTIHWIYDPAGNNGKTDLCEWMEYKDLAIEVPPMRLLEDIMACVMDQPPAKCYLIDFPRAMKKEKLYDFYSGIESLKNGVQFDKRYHFKKRRIDRPNVFVFANVQPNLDCMSRDRWCVWTIDAEKRLVHVTI